MNTPQTLLPRQPNPAYRGLSLQAAHGGYHLHFPDHAGPRPYYGDVKEDWNRIMRVHAREFSTTVLLVGVGIGEPSHQCSPVAP